MRASTFTSEGDDTPTPASGSRTGGSPSRLLRFSTTSSTRSGQDELRRSFDTRSFTVDRVCTDTETIVSRYAMGDHEIGVGGYGKVYLAKDRMFKDRQVAIKKIVKSKEDRTQNLEQEVKIMKELDHPNICRLFETYESERFMFFVLEFCEGGDLFDRIQESHGLQEPVAAKVIKQVASALLYAHARGIAHRDLKPENICFCTRDPDSSHIKVIDWGLGKFFHLNCMKSNVGSSAYAAPEVLDGPQKGEGYTSACDLWSLGVVLYISLSGKAPFWGSFHEQLKKMRSETYPMSSELWMRTSNEAKDVIKKLLKREPKERMTIDKVLHHPWMNVHRESPDLVMMAEVLEKLEAFSHAPDFFSMLVASAARQLDFKSLGDVHAVFCTLDTNGDGVLDVNEIKAGFEMARPGRSRDDLFPGGSRDDAFSSSYSLEEVETMFSRLDFDGTGLLNYTEFCAGGMGEEAYMEEHVLWATFKIFDVRDDGRITKEEMRQVLSNADVNKVWSTDVWDDVDAFMRQFGDEDGTVDFKDWLHLMRWEAAKQNEETTRRKSQSQEDILSCLKHLNSANSVESGSVDLSPRRTSKGEIASFCRSYTADSVDSDNPYPSEELRKVCSCGNVFMPDAIFCRKCGARRSQASDASPAAATSSPSSGCLAGVCQGGCAIS